MNALLHAESLSFSYTRGMPVLEDVSAAVSAGTMTGIVGPNGSGKSTLLRLLCGLARPETGRVTLDGKALSAYGGRARAKRVAYLPQSINPAFSLKAFEVVCLGRYPHTGNLGSLGRADLAVARRCLDDAGAAALADRDFLSLSGGERQRVLLASVLAQEPALLLLDEPTSSLDLHHEEEVFALLRRLAEAGYGIGLVTHDVNRAARYCHGLLLLGADHAVHASGTPAEVLEPGVLSAAYGAPIRAGVHPFAGTPFVDAGAPAS